MTMTAAPSRMPTPRRGRPIHLRSRHILAAGMVSGLLLWASFPPLEWSWLAWVALAPLFWLVTLRDRPVQGPTWRPGSGAWSSGCWPSSGSGCSTTAGGLGWVVMALVFSLWWPLFLAVARLAVLRLALPLMMAAPIIWVGLEYVPGLSSSPGSPGITWRTASSASST